MIAKRSMRSSALGSAIGLEKLFGILLRTTNLRPQVLKQNLGGGGRLRRTSLRISRGSEKLGRDLSFSEIRNSWELSLALFLEGPQRSESQSSKMDKRYSLD